MVAFTHPRPSVRPAVLLRLAATALVLLVAGVAPLARAASGGPDFYGYTWRDSAEPGITYAWEDITVTGTEIPMVADDRNSGFQALSFAFPYRGIDHARVAACTNGWASVVDGASDNYENQALPNGGTPRGTFAAFWDDFAMQDGGKVFFQDFGDRAVISWIDVPYFNDRTKIASFQLILHADGRIVSQIASTTGPLNSATIGIEDADGADGLTAWFNGPIPAPPYAVQFDPPVPLVPALDCAGAQPLDCGADYLADLATGLAGQSQYRCTRADFSGREHVYLVDYATPTSVRIVFEAITGNPQVLIVPTCDPNACSIPASNLISLVGYVGSFYLVVDSGPGQEGQYRLRAECLPIATDLDCAAPIPISCGMTISGDTAAGTDLQDLYWCSLDDYSGREQVYAVDFPVQLPTATITLSAASGNPDLIVLYPCDANACQATPGDVVTLTDPVGTYWIVVDSAPGAEGAYDLTISGGAPPVGAVGESLRATGHGLDSVDWQWLGADLPLPGEQYAVLRADDDPRGPFEVRATLRGRTWTDDAAPARFPRHVWYYTVRLTDTCGNLSID